MRRLASMLLIGALVPTGATAQRTATATWLEPCPVGRAGDGLCGTYEVWENRDARRGRRIGIHVVVLPATGTEPNPDPVFYFAGGPGASAASSAAGIAAALAAVRERRDLVFVDIRGTGRSHPLRCETAAPDAPLQDWFGEMLPDAFVRDCLASLDADPAWYTNPPAMDDVDEIRAALGYERINLYGTSGGTRSAQVYMRRHPAAVRTAILKGTAPMDMENPLPHARSLEKSVAALIAACGAEPACNRAYPDLAGDWERSKRRFDEGPVEATVRHPESGRQGRVRIDRGTYADGVRHILYTISASRRLPAMIHDAAAGNFDAFAQRELEQAIGFNRMLAYGEFLSVTCAEDLRFMTEDDIERETAGTFLGDYRVRRQLAACSIWPRGVGVDEGFQQPLRVETPVLLLSGEHDAATPPDLAQRVADALPNALHIVFPNQSHDSVNPACERRIMADFIEAGTTAGLDLGCVADTRRPPFIIPGSGAGLRDPVQADELDVERVPPQAEQIIGTDLERQRPGR